MCAFKQIKESCKFEQEKPTVLSLKRCTQQTQVNVKHSRLNSNHFMPCKLTMVTHMQKNYKHIKGLNIHSLKIAAHGQVQLQPISRKKLLEMNDS